MDTAYIDEEKAKATCCWNAPDKVTIAGIFEKAGVTAESIQEVVEYA